MKQKKKKSKQFHWHYFVQQLFLYNLIYYILIIEMFQFENLDAGSKNVVLEVKEERQKRKKTFFLFHQSKIQIKAMHVKMFTDNWLELKMIDQIGYSYVLG